MTEETGRLIDELSLSQAEFRPKVLRAIGLSIIPLLALLYSQEWLIAGTYVVVISMILVLYISRVTADLHRSNTQLALATRDAAQERERYQTLFDNAPEAYFILSAKDGGIVECNHGAERMLRGTREQLLAKLPFELSPERQPSGESSKTGAREITRKIVAQGALTFEWVHLRFDGEPFWVEVEIRAGKYLGHSVYFSTWRDIGERKRLEADLVKLANEDQLTGLMNRHSVIQAFERLQSHAMRQSTGVTLFYIDLDKFKYVNDSYGHQTGDALLQMVATRFRAFIRQEDLAARLGGDEFVLVFEGNLSVQQIEHKANQLADLFASPVELLGHNVNVGLSIGIACFPNDGCDFDGLLRAADNALYKAKELGRRQHQFFSDEMADKAAEHLRIEAAISRALSQGEFSLVYQPQINLNTQTVYGVEALLRWNDPELGLVYPAAFLQVAEDSNQIEELESWILLEAFTQAKAWYDAGVNFGRMAVNLSPRSLHRPYAFRLISEALEKTQCPTFLLEAEISENFLLTNEIEGIAELMRIRRLGIELALDDFGTGFSSLRYLQKMPIDKLKIDKSFIDEIDHNQSDHDIVSATIAMAHKLNLIVIAEGVESAAQLDVLCEERCDVVQGYIYYKPQPPEMLFTQASLAQS